MPDVNTISTRIYRRAMEGSPVNPGLPDQLARLVAQMAAHETDGYTSNAWIQDHNAFGYKFVPPSGSRYQVGPGIRSSEGDPFGRYADYLDSVDEVVDWIYRRQREGIFPADLRYVTTSSQFAQLLKNGHYYGDTVTNYSRGLDRWQFAVKATAVGAGVLLVLAIIAIANRQWFVGGSKKLKKRAI